MKETIHGLPIERTETYQWDEDTKTIKKIEERLKSKNYNYEEEHFDLFCKVESVLNRTSLNGRGKYYDRMIHCKKLQECILNEPNIHKGGK